MQNRILLLVIMMLSLQPLIGQELHPCGTKDHKSDWLVHYQRYADDYETRGGEVLYVPLTIHVVSNDDGSGEITPDALFGSLCTLNEDFAASNIHFYIQDEIRFLSRSIMYTHTDLVVAANQMFELNVPNTINCYIVGTAAGNCGYNLPYAGVVLDISCANPADHTWAHEIGHNLSLPHPFLGWEGGHGYDGPNVGTANSDVSFNDPAPEKVVYNYTLFQDQLYTDTLIIDTAFVERMDGSNCEYAADGFCDTAPDYLAFRWNCNSNGVSSVNQTDPSGEQFKSDGSLIMSYSLGACSTRFSEEQCGAMRANLLDEKPDYLGNQVVGEEITATEIIYNIPAEGESVPFDFVEIEWEPIENATHYWVQIGILPEQGFRIWSDIVTGTSAIADIDPIYNERDAYVTVIPYNSYEFCTEAMNESVFFLSDLSDAEDISPRPWSLLPSVISAGSQVYIESEENLSQARINIIDMTGKLLLESTIQQQEITIPSTWSTGVYLVQIQLGTQVHTQRIVVR